MTFLKGWPTVNRIYNFMRIRRLSIGQKLLAIVLTIVIIVMSVVATFRISTSVKASEMDFQSKINTTSKLSVLAFSSPLWNFDNAGIIHTGQALMQDPEIAFVVVKTNEGKEIYNEKLEGIAYANDLLKVTDSPIYNENQQIGIVSIGITQYYRQASLKNDIFLTLGGIAAAVVFLWTLITWAVFRVTRPLAELEAGTEEIAKGHFEKRLDVSSKDEIGRLAAKFNGMTENLEQMMAERDRILDALRLSEEKFAKAFQYSAEIIGIIGYSDKKYIEINDIYVETLGYSREEVIGHTSVEFGLWDDDEEYAEVYDALQTEGAFKNFEMHWKSKSQKHHVGLCSGVLAEIGNRLCLIIVWHDITERKKAEDELLQARNSLELKVEERTSELNAMNQELRATNEELFDAMEQLKNTQAHLIQSEKLAALGGLVAGVAHEINTPIGVSITAVSYLEKMNLEFKQLYETNALKKKTFEEYMAHIDESTNMIMLNLDRAAKLVNSFKQVSIDQSSEHQRVFNVYSYLTELLSSLHPKLKTVKQTVRVECDESLQIDSYPGSLAQIVTNFIMNALLHAFKPEDEGEMLIKIYMENKNMVLEFEDNGKGMDKEVISRIYEPFFTTKRGPSGGTGLGLHIVYNIVIQKFNGSIVCNSTVDKGTKFVIKFPVVVVK